MSNFKGWEGYEHKNKKPQSYPATMPPQTPKKKGKKQNPEYSIQAAFVAKMEQMHPLVMVFSDTAAHIGKTMFQQIRANKLQSATAKDWPDIFIAQPSGQYAGLFLECKAKSPYIRDGITLSKDRHIQAQSSTMQRLRERGYFCAFFCGVEQGMEITEKYLTQSPPRRV